MKFIYLLILLLLTSLVVGEEINYYNSTLDISSIVELNSSEEQSSVFYIKNLNYSTGDDPLLLNYTQILLWKNETLFFQNVTKELKSYTKSNTGLVKFDKEGNYSLIFKTQNQSLVWNYYINYSEEINNSENNTNSTNFVYDCDNFNVNTDKKIYLSGEKVSIYFNNVEIEEFNITYWVEDLNGNLMKPEYTTQNSNTKSYTPKISENEKAMIVYAKLNTNFCEKESTSLFVVDNYDNEVEEVEAENYLEIKSILQEEDLVFSSIHVEKNIGTKRIVKVFVIGDDGKKVSEEIKLDLKNKIKFDLDLVLVLKEKLEKAKLVVEGLGEEVNESFNLYYDDVKSENIVLNRTTQKKYVGGTFDWNVKIKGSGEGILIINSSDNQLFVKNLTLDGTNTFSFKIDANNSLNLTTLFYSGGLIEKFNDEVLLIDNTKKEIVVPKLVQENVSPITGAVVKENFEEDLDGKKSIPWFLVITGVVLIFVILNVDKFKKHFDRFIKNK